MKRPHQENDEEELVLEDDLGQKDNKILKLSSPTSSQEGNASCAQDNDSIPHINRAPSDCLVHIFEYCPAPELLFTTPLVCRSWNNIITVPHVEELLWKQLCLNEWPVLLSIPTSAAQIEDGSFLNRGGFKGWKQFFHRYATVIPPLLHQKTRDMIMDRLVGAKELQVLPSMSDTPHDLRSYLQGVHSYLADSILNFINSVVAKLDKSGRYQLDHQQFMKRYMELKEQAEQAEQAKQEMDTVLSDNKHELAQKMEQLFLDCFKLLVDSRDGEWETNTLTILGPSGQLIQIDLTFSVYAWGSGYYAGNIRDPIPCCSVKLLGRPQAAMILYRHVAKTPVSPSLLSDMKTIRKHLGLQYLSIEELWNSIIERTWFGFDVHSYYEEMKRTMQEKLSGK